MVWQLALTLPVTLNFGLAISFNFTCNKVLELETGLLQCGFENIAWLGLVYLGLFKLFKSVNCQLELQHQEQQRHQQQLQQQYKHKQQQQQ